ncbi:MAG: CHASE2 domain-containing protein, partial [Pseudobdellovibrio sp.]
MKKNLKLIQWGLFAITLCLLIVSLGVPQIKNSELLSAYFDRAEGFVTDLKFQLRGENPVKSSLTLVEVDNRTLEEFSEYGRWPWQRDPQAFLIYSVLKYQPKLLVLDIIYSEKESVRIPLELEGDLQKIGRQDLV